MDEKREWDMTLKQNELSHEGSSVGSPLSGRFCDSEDETSSPSLKRTLFVLESLLDLAGEKLFESPLDLAGEKRMSSSFELIFSDPARANDLLNEAPRDNPDAEDTLFNL
jgi:hypothetical protein